MTNEAHIRSDDGVARGPKHPVRKLRRPKEGAEWTIPDGLDPDRVIMQYLTEGKTSGIAAKHGIRRSVLTRWLQIERPKQWKEAQIIRALCMKEDGQEAIYDSTSGLALARARAVLDASQWDLERLSDDYRQKQEVAVTHDHRVLIEHTLTGSARELFQSMRGVPNPIIDLQPDTVQQSSPTPKQPDNTE